MIIQELNQFIKKNDLIYKFNIIMDFFSFLYLLFIYMYLQTTYPLSVIIVIMFLFYIIVLR